MCRLGDCRFTPTGRRGDQPERCQNLQLVRPVAPPGLARPPSRRRSVRSVAGPSGSRVVRAILRWMSQVISKPTRPERAGIRAKVIAIHRFVDMPLNCVRCGSAFVLSAGEQELYALRGVTLRTTLCPACVRDRVYR